jgi:flavin-dependent dehydrogenase
LCEVDKGWIRSDVNHVEFGAPDGTIVRYSEKNSGYVIDRGKMHKGLAESCLRNGVDCSFRAQVKQISLRNEQNMRAVTFKINGELHNAKAPFVIDASGAGDTLDTNEGLESGAIDLETAVFALVKTPDGPKEAIRLYYHHGYFPGGYGWAFPREGDVVNVGLVIAKEFVKEKTAKKHFEEWLHDVWPQSEVLSWHGGPIPCGQGERPLAVNGLFKAGDSASGVNPLSRGGILEGMRAGTEAARAIAAIMRGELSEKEAQKQYQNAWLQHYGNSHRRLARVKKSFTAISDDTFNKAAHKINALAPEKRTLFRIFWSTLISSPKMLWQMRSLFW